MKIVLHAPNVHQGGGLTLLKELISLLPDTAQLILDERFSVPFDRLRIYYVKPCLWHRFRAECFLKYASQSTDVVLCMGNLPPLFSLKKNVNLFLQNRYALDRSIPLDGYSYRVRIRLFLERLWLFSRIGNVDRIIVQNKSMQEIVSRILGRDSVTLPYIPQIRSLAQNTRKEHSSKDKKNIVNSDFIYVASGEPHKNHRNLVLAWVELSECGLFPSLCLTVDRDIHPSLCAWIDKRIIEHKLNIRNMGVISHEKVLYLYGHVKALIFPSLLESFGLPLVEADQLGLPIVASELDFVRDVVCPKETFDPKSVKSIARAVRRFLGSPEPFVPILSGNEFLTEIAEGCQ